MASALIVRLDRLAADIYQWPAVIVIWLRHEDWPDGLPRRTPGSGIPGGGSIGTTSDRTGDAAMQRADMGCDEGGSLERQLDTLAADVERVTCVLWAAVAGRQVSWPWEGPVRAMNRAAVAVDSMALRARTGEAKIPARVRLAPVATTDADGDPEGTVVPEVETRHLLDQIDTDLRLLREIVGATNPALLPAQKCMGWGPWELTCGEWAVTSWRDPDTGHQATSDPLCDRCRKMKAFRCEACSKGIERTAPAPVRPVKGGMHEACYVAARRAESRSAEQTTEAAGEAA